MSNICSVCGLPKEICICKKISAEQQEIFVREKRKKYKMVTEIEGLPKEEAESLLKEMKKEFACGGTLKDGIIELRGRHLKKVKEFLLKKNYLKENIK